MMATFHLKIVSINGVFYNAQCNCLVIPAIDGERAVMAHHEEMVIAVKSGTMRLQSEKGGEWHEAVVGQGFCQIANNRVTLLVDTVERPEDVDANRAREALERAQERLRQQQSIKEYYMTQSAMARALVRLKETEKFTH